MASVFSPLAHSVESKVNELLYAAGWAKTRLGNAASGCFTIGKTSNGIESIGLWTDWELVRALKVWPVTTAPEVITNEMLALVAAVTYPEITYLTNSCGEVHTGRVPTKLMKNVPFDDGPGYVLSYVVRIAGQMYVLGNLEVAYKAEAWDGMDFPDEAVVKAACLAAIDDMRTTSAPAVIVFPLDHDDMPDRCVISVAIPVREGHTNYKERLANAFKGYEGMEKLYSTKA